MKAAKILTAQAVPGMIVAEDVYTKDHHLVIAKDTTLSDKIITRLEFYSITDLSVLTDTNIIEKENTIIETTFYEEIKKSEAFRRFHKAYISTVNDFQNTLNNIVTNDKEIDTDHLLTDLSKILYQCNTNIELFNMLHCMREFDDTTYVHSLNVSLICNIIGKWLHFSPEDLEVITLCGLLHDLGKLLIPSDIITKPAKLTQEEYTTIKTHALRGYNLLKDKNIDSRIKNAALMHHERCDGSGYPYGLTNEHIEPFAKLVSIADVYDAMTCARVYRGPLCPFEVVSIFETEGYTKYDPKYIMTFLEGIVQTYIHNNVRLNDKKEGEIVLINRFELSRPVVKVNDQFIDLSKHRNLYIESLI
ncbi:HD-GYP domain-containing protein [Mobilitalea sibirica]|uniref:HD-GYP domain-containing protein n=1 Tax=Mobilitalea sibirica TaxID=1462919 RepID=A0A8J7H3W1_9FIRM|nr:HD-GYP domain-containing protein [Mobilitalea sibirica]MBH1941897.1 HD-GYP domain-containing protein [Mobilitalea sibirica]